jgi:putative DNA methylase
VTYKKKLIEVAIPLAVINEHSAKQKTMGAAPHPQNLHRWWARRPLAAARAVLFAQLVDDPSAHPDKFPSEEDQHLERKRLFDLMERLIPWDANNDADVFAEAHAEILKSCDGDLPKILDPFGGGGAIPLESLRLGLPTYSGDLNPVAVLIQRAMLEIPQRFANRPPVHPDVKTTRAFWSGTDGLATDLQAYGRWMQEEAKRRIGHHYPDAILEDGTKATPIAWIWARTVKSPDPSWPGHVPLVRSWELAKKAGKPTVWIEPIVDTVSKTIRYEIRHGGKAPSGTVISGKAVCLATGVPISLKDVDEAASKGELGAVLIAVVAEQARGRAYAQPTSHQSAAAESTPSRSELDSMTEVPHGTTRGTFAGNAQGRFYGFFDFADYFTPRQLLALTTFSDLLPEVRERVIADHGGAAGQRLRDGGDGAAAYADAIVTYLSFAIDKAADFWSSICSWEKNNGQLRYTFARQAIPMTWDFAEANPFSERLASWLAMVDGVIKGLAALPTNGHGSTAQRDARARISEIGSCVLSTDPPYYDNISYADLADFFYVWMRRNLKDVWPDECATLLTPKVEELIANQYRAGSKAAAHTHFELGMQGVFGRAAENADERFPATVFYAFKATEKAEAGVASTGWETFLGGLLEAGFAITATWPVRTELAAKIGANAGDNMLASSIVLACRKRHLTAPMATRGEFVAAMRNEMPHAIQLLQEQNIAPVDMAQSAIGPGIAIFSRYAKVVEADGSSMTVRTALALINEVLAEVLSGEEGEFDADTRFAVTWFEQYGHNPGPFGDADTLSKAKNTTVTNVVQSGIAASRDGRLRLVERKELPEDWDPAADSRLTVWETTQHLIRALEQSETNAADLLRRMGGGMGERARQLAYLLYGVCDRKKWADEAGAYNMLVTAWPTIERLAQSPTEGDSAPRMF